MKVFSVIKYLALRNDPWLKKLDRALKQRKKQQKKKMKLMAAGKTAAIKHKRYKSPWHGMDTAGLRGVRKAVTRAAAARESAERRAGRGKRILKFAMKVWKAMV